MKSSSSLSERDVLDWAGEALEYMGRMGDGWQNKERMRKALSC